MAKRALLLSAALLLISAGCVSQTLSTSPSQDVTMTDPAQLLVRQWYKPGIFDKATMAELNGDRLYVAGYPRGLEAVNVNSGLTDWIHVGKLPVDFTPKVREDVGYLVEGGQVVVLDNNTGIESKRVRTKVGFLTPLYPGESTWVTAGADEYVHGITPGTGVRAFRRIIEGFPIDSAWDGDDIAFVVTSAGRIYGVSASGHTIAWTVEFSKKHCSPMGYYDGILYVGNQDYRLYAIDAINGTVQWAKLLGAPVLPSAPLAANGRVYAATSDGMLHAVNIETQEELWAVSGVRALTATDEHLVFLRTVNGDNFVGVADIETGDVLTEVTALPFSLFVAEPTSGVFYAIDGNGGVLAMSDRAAAEDKRAAASQMP